MAERLCPFVWGAPPRMVGRFAVGDHLHKCEHPYGHPGNHRCDCGQLLDYSAHFDGPDG